MTQKTENGDLKRAFVAALTVLLTGLALNPLLAWRMLTDEVAAVEAALGRSLEEVQQQLARIVSRDVTQLNEEQVRESAIESLSENLNDSVIAPLFWFALLGLPGAALFRYADTADSMWGYRGDYRGQVWEWAGKWAARIDDALAWVPARITGLALLLSGMRPTRCSLQRLQQEAAQTPSPNSGWPMAAMAMVLDVRLRKPGVYTLHAAGQAALRPVRRRAVHRGPLPALLVRARPAGREPHGRARVPAHRLSAGTKKAAAGKPDGR